MIAVRHIDKWFGQTQALRDVSLEVAPGTVHGVLGENGAGKSTLMHILFGMIQPDAGTIAIAGAPTHIRSARHARALGIGMVHQHFKLVPTLTVLDNLVLALGNGVGVVDRALLRDRLLDQAAILGWRLEPDGLVETLSVGQRQRVEILKALCRQPQVSTKRRILILDEPTAVLTPEEATQLITALRALVDADTCVILISHKLVEIEQACDVVSILRKGRLVHHAPVRDLTRAQMTSHLLGDAVQSQPDVSPVAHKAHNAQGAQSAHPSSGTRSPACCLRLDHVQVPGRNGRPVLSHVNLQVDPGEIVGIAGVAGNGQEELVDLILGLTRPGSGHLHVIADRRHLGVVPEDRHQRALILPMPVVDNLLLKDYAQSPFARWGWIKRQEWRRHANQLRATYDIRCDSIDQPMDALSGGNQQKAVIARELQGEPALIIAHNPTRGLDIGASAFVFAQLRTARARGAGILLLHQDLDELLSIADRVLVLCAGRLQTSTWPEGGRLAVGRLMVAVDQTQASA